MVLLPPSVKKPLPRKRGEPGTSQLRGMWGLRDEVEARFYCLVVNRFGEGTMGSAQVVKIHMGWFETVTACSDRS